MTPRSPSAATGRSTSGDLPHPGHSSYDVYATCQDERGIWHDGPTVFIDVRSAPAPSQPTTPPAVVVPRGLELRVGTARGDLSRSGPQAGASR